MLKSQQVVAPPRVLRPHETIRVHLHSHVSDLHEVLLQELVELKLLALSTERRIFYGGVIQSYLVECLHVSACELHCVSDAHTQGLESLLCVRQVSIHIMLYKCGVHKR